MIWNNPSEFFAMGGYALYIWGSYTVTLAALLIEPALTAARHRRALNEIANGTSSEE